MINLEVREVRKEDIPKLSEFFSSMDYKTNQLYTHKFNKDPSKRAKDLFYEDSDKLIVLKDREIIAWGNLIRDPAYPGVPSLGICVKPEYRNRGIGHILVEELIDFGIGKYKGIYIQVKKENLIALKLYQEYNFKIAEEKNGMVCLRYEY